MLYFQHPSSLEHDPSVLCPDHPDVPERIEAIEAAMAVTGWSRCERRQAPAARERELALVHRPEHVRFIRELCASGPAEIDADTFVSDGSYGAALHAAGGACAMVRALVAGEANAGFCGLRPAGHHADRDRAMGFCVFNNHEADLFPGTGNITDSGSADGRGYTINIPVPRGSIDEVWLSVLEHVIIPAALEFEPQLLLVSTPDEAVRTR